MALDIKDASPIKLFDIYSYNEISFLEMNLKKIMMVTRSRKKLIASEAKKDFIRIFSRTRTSHVYPNPQYTDKMHNRPYDY